MAEVSAESRIDAPPEKVWAQLTEETGRLLTTRGKGPMGVNPAMRYSLTPDGNATTMRIDGEFTGAAVSMMAGRLKDSATAALNESLRKPGALATAQ